MSTAIINLNEMNNFIDRTNLSDKSKKWCSIKLRRHISKNKKWLKKTRRTSFQNHDEFIERALKNREEIFEIDMESMKRDTRRVFEWITYLEKEDERSYRKLDNMNWEQAEQKTTKWHEYLYEKSKRLKTREIKFDKKNCPVIYEHANGMKWVWLKTDKARDDESRSMSHCVGHGYYDDMKDSEGIFSLRTKDGVPKATIYLIEGEINEESEEKNGEISKETREMVEEFIEFMKPKMTMEFDHVRKYMENGQKDKREHLLKFWSGTKKWYKDGRLHKSKGPAIIRYDGEKEFWVHGYLHREDGPAVMLKHIVAWYEHGRLHRKNGPAIIRSNGSEEWWTNGRRHRSFGPAVIDYAGRKEWWMNGIQKDPRFRIAIYELMETMKMTKDMIQSLKSRFERHDLDTIGKR